MECRPDPGDMANHEFAPCAACLVHDGLWRDGWQERGEHQGTPADHPLVRFQAWGQQSSGEFRVRKLIATNSIYNSRLAHVFAGQQVTAHGSQPFDVPNRSQSKPPRLGDQTRPVGGKPEPQAQRGRR